MSVLAIFDFNLLVDGNVFCDFQVFNDCNSSYFSHTHHGHETAKISVGHV
jgi:hypothetical protein